MAQKKSFPIEKGLEDLEKIVNQMETQQLTLEESLKSFENGVKIVKKCQEALGQAERKIEILSEQSPDASLETFEEGTEE